MMIHIKKGYHVHVELTREDAYDKTPRKRKGGK